MKELDSFTVERLEEITELKALSFPPSHAESAALARIALAAKMAEPVAYMRESHEGREYNGHNEFSGGGRGIALYTTPQLNSPEIPEGWKLVPNVVTTEMTDAARIIDGRLSAEKYHRIYRLMLAAAPEKPL